MPRERVSITIEKDRLAEVDALAELLGLDRSRTMERIIDVGKPLVEASHYEHHHKMQSYVHLLAEAIREGRVAPLPEGVSADADMVAETDGVEEGG